MGKVLKSADVKSNHENMMKSNDGIFFHHGSENKGTCFLSNSLNKNISREIVARLLNEERKAAATLRYSEKQLLPIRIEAAIKSCSLK